MVNVVAHICFWSVFAVGSCTTIYGVAKLGYAAYKKIRDTFTQHRLNKAMKK